MEICHQSFNAPLIKWEVTVNVWMTVTFLMLKKKMNNWQCLNAVAIVYETQRY